MTQFSGKLHHESWCKGYIGRGNEIVRPYAGRFGVGYTVEYQTVHSNRYHRIAYYIVG